MRLLKLAFAALLCAVPSHAAVFVVNTATDNAIPSPGGCRAISRSDAGEDLSQLDQCSLRDAVAAANALGGTDEILINLPGVKTINLLAALPINEDIELNAVQLASWTNQQLITALVIQRVGGGDLITLGAGANLEVLSAGGAVNTTLEDDLTGAGTLSKGGNGVLLLNGTNDITGSPTAIAQGTLRGDTASIPGGTAMTPLSITNSGTLSFDQEVADAPDFFGKVSGTGNLEKLGDGTLFLRGVNTFTGTTTIAAGTLKGFVAAGGSSLVGNAINITSTGALLVFEQAADGTFAGSINGVGSVAKNGPGTLTLTGNNGFSGKLTISQGVVILDADAVSAADVEIANAAGAQVVFDQADDDTFAGDISGGSGGAPGLVKRGAGKLSLTGANSFAGGARVEAGELEIDTGSLPDDAELVAGSTLSFNQTENGSFSGAITGTGDLIKRGSGTLSLLESQTFTGTTTIEAGALVVGVAGQGAGAGTTLPGALAIQGGGELAGIGFVDGPVTVGSGARVSPGGDAPGTLRVGSVTFDSGSNFEVGISPIPASSDRLNVDGTATLNGGTIDLSLVGVAPGAEFTATILQAGSIAGTGLLLPPDSFPFFDLTLVQGASSLMIDVDANDATTLPGLARTPNQLAVANALTEAFAANPTGDLADVFSAIVAIPSEDGVSQALADMSGEQLTEFATARLAISDRFQNSLHERIRGVAWRDGEGLISQRESEAGVFAANPIVNRMLPGLSQGAGPWPIAVAGQSMSSILDSSDGFGPAPGELGVGGWLDGYGLLGTLEGDSGAVDVDYLIGGFSLGVDYRFHPNWLVGLAGGYAHTELDFDELSGDQSAETGQGALYLGYVTPWLQIGGTGRFGYSAMSTTRDIDFISRDNDADFDGFDAGGRLDAAIDLFEVRGVELQPLASFSYTHVQQDEIDESGADSLDITADEEEVDSIVSGLGARVHGVLEIDDQLWFHPELRARWNHEFGDTERELSSAQIGGQPGAVFKVSGAEFPSDTGVIGVSWTLVSQGRLHAFIDYDVTLASELIQHGVAVGAKFVW